MNISKYFKFATIFITTTFLSFVITNLNDVMPNGSFFEKKEVKKSTGLNRNIISNKFAFAPEICNNGIDDDGDGLIDYLDSDCFCNDTLMYSRLDFNSYIVEVGNGLNSGDRIRYTNVGSVGGQQIDIVATIVSLTNTSSLLEHGILGNDALVRFPNGTIGAGTDYTAEIIYQLYLTGTTTPINADFEIEVNDLDRNSGREESLSISMSDFDSYFLNTPSNVNVSVSGSNLVFNGTQVQVTSDPEAAVKIIFSNKNSFTINYQVSQLTNSSTGVSGFDLDGDNLNVLGSCVEICNNGIDDNNNGFIDYLDSECFCNDTLMYSRFDFDKYIIEVGNGLNSGNRIRYTNVGSVGGQQIDIVATIVSLTNTSSLLEHGILGNDALVRFPNGTIGAGTDYTAEIIYQLYLTGTTNPINADFEIEVNDLDRNSGREESLSISMSNFDNYFLNTPSNIDVSVSGSNLVFYGTQVQVTTDPEAAVKLIFDNKSFFTITYQVSQLTNSSTGVSGFDLDGDNLNILGSCVEICDNGIDDDNDGLIDCDDPDCQLTADASQYSILSTGKSAKLTANATGGSGVYDFAWQGLGQSSSYIVTPWGIKSYILSSTDSYGCIDTDTITIDLGRPNCICD